MRRPKAGERYAKLITDKNGITFVRSRTVLRIAPCGIYYTPKRVERYCGFGEWRAWMKGAHRCKPLK